MSYNMITDDKEYEEDLYCPVCGSIFDIVLDYNNICNLEHGPYDREELIGEDEDYEWVL